MSEITISAEGLKAFAKQIVVETLKELRKSSMTKSEYSRVYKISRPAIDRMIAQNKLTLNKQGRIIVDYTI